MKTETEETKKLKKVAIITGATSGIGRRFAKTVHLHYEYDELWLLDNDEESLVKFTEELDVQKVKAVVVDLGEQSVYGELSKMIAQENVLIVLLVNCAEFGKSEDAISLPLETVNRMFDINCRAVMSLCHICRPYMRRGSRILNVSSMAAFRPVPHLAEYGASKAFVLNFSRALSKKLKPEGITVTALCPDWTETKHKQIVDSGWKALERGKDMAACGFAAHLGIFLASL